MRQLALFPVLAFSVFTLVACSSSSSGGTGTSPTGGDAATSSNVCYSVAVNTEDGSSACGGTTCSAGQFCDLSCNAGCLATNNCATGQYCDLSNPSTLDGTPFGTCHVPGADKVIACGSSDGGADAGSACGDVKAVDGAYKLTLDTAGSTAICMQAFPASTCTVTQTGCTLNWSCTPTLGFETSTLDDTGKSTINFSMGGQSGTCAMSFDYVVQTGNTVLTFDCQSTSGTAIDCKGTGTD